MRTYLFIRRTVVLTSLALIPWFPAPLAPAAELSPGGGIPEFMTMQPSMQRPALLMMTAPAQATPAQTTSAQDFHLVNAANEEIDFWLEPEIRSRHHARLPREATDAGNRNA